MKYEKSCGAVIFTETEEGRKFVVIKQTAGFHGFPKGHMEQGETERETAIREIFEETGLRPTILDGFKTVEEHPIPQRPGTMKQVVYFLAHYQNQQFCAQQSELSEIKLMSFEEALASFEYDNSKRVLKEACEFLKNNV